MPLPFFFLRKESHFYGSDVLDGEHFHLITKPAFPSTPKALFGKIFQRVAPLFIDSTAEKSGPQTPEPRQNDFPA